MAETVLSPLQPGLVFSTWRPAAAWYIPCRYVKTLLFYRLSYPNLLWVISGTMYASKKANWHLVLVVFPLKHYLWKWTKPPRWPTKMAVTPTSARQLSLLLQIPFVIHVYCGLLAWYTCTVVCWQSPNSPTPPPILLCSSLRVQLRAKTKTKY